eukprot:scaffold24241_cov53-Attheya_sp.AAC.3
MHLSAYILISFATAPAYIAVAAFTSSSVHASLGVQHLGSRSTGWRSHDTFSFSRRAGTISLSESKTTQISDTPNEFSRQYQIDSILGSRRREYAVSLDATEEERAALAARFNLSCISRLESDMTLRRDYGSNRGGDTVYSEGVVVATVAQTCVRTGEIFDVDLEFSFSSAMRAVCTTGGSGGSLQKEEDDDLEQKILATLADSGGQKKKKKYKNKKSMRDPGQALNDMGLDELQNLLSDFDLDEDVIEDENILSTNGVLDLGELVAQNFRLKLDPYPKKPGSKPINISFSG